MELPSTENATFTIFTIKLGTEDTFFATLTGITGKKLDYSSSAKYRINLLFSKRDGHKENSFQMIAEGVLNFDLMCRLSRALTKYLLNFI
ncbi:unnamed protein product [Meloidogyne enterolobii]|uniref:Uncharacterized protein n=1 Tax=Meloidogyne enterolobii TaxID=390850 RepID=A0ACB0YN31_MELEN